MATAKVKTEYIGYYEEGTEFNIPVNFVKNGGPGIATNVVVTVTIPDGVEYSSSSLDQGSFNSTTNKWTIASLNKGQQVSAVFTFTVTDDCAGPFSFTFEVTTLTGCDSCLDNNIYCVIAQGVPCCSISACFNESIATISDVLYEVTDTDDVLLADASANIVEFSLPDPADAYSSNKETGKKYTFKLIDNTNPLILQTPSGKIIDDQSEADSTDGYVLEGLGDVVTIISNGTNWYVIVKILSSFLTYQPVYTPGYSPDAYTPNYTPGYSPVYAPNYAPTYAPSYTPTYTTPSYTPIYAPIYTPTYTPIYSPIYAPTYTPIYSPIYTPSYAPN